MEPGSEDPGYYHRFRSLYDNDDASMEPGSEDPGYVASYVDSGGWRHASMEPGSEDPGYAPFRGVWGIRGWNVFSRGFALNRSGAWAHDDSVLPCHCRTMDASTTGDFCGDRTSRNQDHTVSL